METTWQCDLCQYQNLNTANACLVCGNACEGNQNENQQTQTQTTSFKLPTAMHTIDDTHESPCVTSTLQPPTQPQAYHTPSDVNSNNTKLQPSPLEQRPPSPSPTPPPPISSHILIFDDDDYDSEEIKEGFFTALPKHHKQSHKSEINMLQFQSCVSDITCYNDNASEIFGVLQSAAEQLLSEHSQDQTLDHTVMDKLLGFDGVLDFLSLLGYKSDDMGTKLVCKTQPNRDLVTCAVKVLQTYKARLQLASHGSGNQDDAKQQDPDTLTLQQIILWSTHEHMHDGNTHDFMDALILTHKQFTNSRTLLYHLRERCDNVPLPPQLRAPSADKQAIRQFQNTVLKIILIKVFRSISVWMANYWTPDFADSAELQTDMTAWFSELQRHKVGKYQHLQWFRYLVDNLVDFFQQQKQHGHYIGQMANVPPILNAVEIDKKLLRKNYRLDSNVSELAQQITLMHYRIFLRVGSRECVGLKWKKQELKPEASHILGMIELFNEWVTFIQLQILLEENARQRGKTIKFMIELCVKLRELRNYDALRAVLSALNSSAVFRLTLAWRSVSESALQQFEELKRLFETNKNSKNYRSMFRDCLPPAIPYFGLFLQDLVFIEEGIEKRHQVDDFKEHGALINFNKSVRTADRITKWLIRYQIKSGYDDKCIPNPPLQQLLYQQLHSIKDLSDEHIWTLSTDAKKSDEKRHRSSSGRLHELSHQLSDVILAPFK